jgi:hypothetical protein
MTGVDSAREAAREQTGQFGVQEHSTPEVTVTAPALWQLEVLYNDGGTDVIVLDSTGQLPTPFKSEQLRLTRLVGFKTQRFVADIDLSVEDAVAEPQRAIGLYPAFDTTYDSITNLLGAVTAFAPIG